MKATASIDIYEMRSILIKALSKKLGYEVEAVTITSYDKPRITIDPWGMVEADNFKHRVKEPS